MAQLPGVCDCVLPLSLSLCRGPLLSASLMAEACLLLIERDDLCGEVLSVTKELGMVLHPIPEYSTKSKQITTIRAKL